MEHKMEQLTYAHDALEPYMSTETLQYHYDRHYNAYITNVNKLIEGTSFERLDLQQIVLEAEGVLFNNAAQAWNHALFFASLSPKPSSLPSGVLMVAMEKEWGSFENFCKEFNSAATSLFGSGWVWLVSDSQGHLSISATQNAANPLRDGLSPILVIDVWEHAYYIDYRNRRAEFIKAFSKIINWEIVDKRYIAAMEVAMA